MPFVHIRTMGRPLAPAEITELQLGATRLMAEVLGKKAVLTAVAIEQLPPGAWSVNGAPVALAAHLEATVTAGTNSAPQKAAFVAAGQALLRRVLGPALAEVTYVVLREVPAESWGWNGLTQAARAA
ncbi:tautomerase family protein [Falsiroseomonas tokyonensis]|uniref:Tautomerase family protein n=1 Tax=Falsiroseomonas tokyonensis TaxID=430521 RepID=A0ABV7BQI7_9PROT|nr:tautomerase family protein [Falsiroseomonas tokyonensis]MBU8537871.1 tautomerase family protein [Falsiroseomonas tokyonensis]